MVHDGAQARPVRRTAERHVLGQAAQQVAAVDGRVAGPVAVGVKFEGLVDSAAADEMATSDTGRRARSRATSTSAGRASRWGTLDCNTKSGTSAACAKARRGGHENFRDVIPLGCPYVDRRARGEGACLPLPARTCWGRRRRDSWRRSGHSRRRLCSGAP